MPDIERALAMEKRARRYINAARNDQPPLEATAILVRKVRDFFRAARYSRLRAAR